MQTRLAHLGCLLAIGLQTGCSSPVRQVSTPGVAEPVLAARDLQCEPLSFAPAVVVARDTLLVFPGVLERAALLQGNPLATYAAMLELEREYLASEIFRSVYPEVRLNFEQFLGFPCAGVQAMRLVGGGTVTASRRVEVLDEYVPRPAVDVIRERAATTRIVIWGEEHHLAQTRSLYESMLRSLWQIGYRYLAAEAFEDADMRDFTEPGYDSGYYLRDPVFASAIRVAQELGYLLISYDTREQGTEPGFRDVMQARNLKERVLDRDPGAKVVVLAGRGHASEVASADGWTPMAHVLKDITGIDPFTVFSPTMTERLTREEEDPLYRYATSRGWVGEAVILAHREHGNLLGSNAFDAHVFFPRTRLVGGRPDWMVTTLGRIPVQIPDALAHDTGLLLIQAFRSPESSTIPQDQVLIDGNGTPVLMLPPGKFQLRSVNRNGIVLARAEVEVRRGR
jgi:hypothetical protein